MKAMVLSAGVGNRLRPLTDHTPKCMIRVGGKPILEHNIEWLKKYGIIELVINLFSSPQVIMSYFEDGHKWGVQITYSLEEKILGTAGGVKRASRYFNDSFLVWYGDNLSTCDLSKLMEFHKAKKGLATITLFHRDEVTASGIMDLDQEQRIIRYLEKPTVDQIFSHWVNAGIYILEPQILQAIPDDGTPDFGHDIFPTLISRNDPLYGYRLSGSEKIWWIDTHEDLQRTQHEFERKNLV